jgi:hypothetical protein
LNKLKSLGFHQLNDGALSFERQLSTSFPSKVGGLRIVLLKLNGKNWRAPLPGKGGEWEVNKGTG